MKRYLTSAFLILTVVILVIGLRFDAYWSGVASWGFAFISLLFAAYFTKYIKKDTEGKK